LIKTVWVLKIDDGEKFDDVCVCLTEAAGKREIYNHVKSWWPKRMGNKPIPEDQEGAVNQYFDNNLDHKYELKEIPFVGTTKGLEVIKSVNGQQIFLKQLCLLTACSNVVEYEPGDNLKIDQLIQEFNVPVEHVDAFAAYCKEYLVADDDAVAIDGPFFNDEDFLKGIRSKYYCFYEGIVSILEHKCAELDMGLFLRVHIDPDYTDATTVLVTAENRYGYCALDAPALIFDDYWKPWQLPFSEPEKPEQVYKELQEMYETMIARLENALKGVAIAC